MHYLECSNCGHLNEVNNEFVEFCFKCKKKMDSSFSSWQIQNPEKTFEEYKRLVCISEEEAPQVALKPKRKFRLWLILALTIATFAVMYTVGYRIGSYYFTESTQKIEKELAGFCTEINRSCPTMIDQITRLDGALIIPPKTIRYSYTLMISETMDTLSVKGDMQPNMLNLIKTSPEMKALRDNRVTFTYSYRDIKGRYLFAITIKPEDYSSTTP